MATHFSRTIGFMAPTINGPYYRGLLAGICAAVQERGLRLTVVQSSPSEVAASGIVRDHIAGWVLSNEVDSVKDVAALGAPVVTISRTIPGASSVFPDNTGGMRAATHHLIALGHHRIAFAGFPANNDTPERLAGYRAALEEAGLPFDERLVFASSDMASTGGYAAGEAMLAAGIDWTAIVAASDYNAFGIVERLGIAGYQFPRDLVIVGFDDLAEAQMFDPPLTTVRQRFDEMGRVATERLLAQLDDPSLVPAELRVATALVVRCSCGAAPASTPTSITVVPAELQACDDWQPALVRHLAAIVQHPLPLSEDSAPADVWPGALVLTEALDAALQNRPLPDATQIQLAWKEATTLTVYGDACNTALVALEQAAEALAVLADDDARARIARTLSELRSHLLKVCLGANARQLTALEEVFDTSDAINHELSYGSATQAIGLTWLRHSSVSWGCLGLWPDASGAVSAGELTVAGVYAPAGSAASPLSEGDRLAARSFPVLHAMPAADVVMLNIVRSAQRIWGVLAIGITYTDRISYVDNSRIWARAIGTRLNDRAMLTELEQQRAGLEEAYERERALSDAVRELGSPVIPLGAGTLLVPLIGVIDSTRAQQIIEVVLGAVSSQRAVRVLLDISGVPLIDTHVAGVLIQLAQMLRLLGANATLIGIRPEIAQSIVSLGVDLRELSSHASLENALRARR